jgi:hypothetical protein
MTRKLLPYEHELVEVLGITEEEYIDFLSIQAEYRDPKEGTIYDTRAILPAAGVAAASFLGAGAAAKTAVSVLTIASLSLTVVGVLFQVAAVLLAEKPASPKAGRNQREQRFSPRFGFNSGQELAQYGDPINLVYCNTSHNPLGGVRIGTSLVWSSVESYGSTQFMQLLLVLGAASIKTLDFERTAFGQLPLGQFSESNTWLYYEDNGPVNFNNKLLGDGKDPTRDGAPGSEDVCRVMFAKSRRDGYSQAFSPSSLTSIGVYDPIPLNIEIQERRNSGKPQWGNLQITIAGGSYGTGSNVSYAVGNQITVVFAKALKRQDKVVQEAAKDMRYQLAESLDRASTYMLGTAKFRLVSVNGGDEVNLDDNDVRAKFECIEAGRRPVTEYDRTRTKIWNESDREELQDAKDILNDPLTDAEKTAIEKLRTSNRPDLYARISPTVFVDDYTFTVAAGRTSSEAAVLALAGQVDSISGGDFVVKLKNFGFQDYKFTGSEAVNWTDELDKKQTLTIPKGGSIAVTRKILRSFLANKPKLDVAALRDEIEDDLEKLRQTIDDLNSGDLDGQFRQAARQAASRIRQSIRERQKEIQKILDEIGLNKKEVKVQKTGGGNADVLNKNTDIKKDLARIESKNDRINELQEERDEIMSDNMAKAKKALIQFYRNTNSPFTAFGNRYGSGGIKAMKRRLAQLKGQRTTDQTGVKKVRDFLNELIKDKEDARNAAKLVLKDWEDFIADADDDFFTKCLVKIESAAYQTVTACDFVKFAIRCKLFRRISGRAKDYGESEAPDGYRLSDNGIHGRMAFFKVSYKETGASTYQGFPVVFAVRRGTDQDNFIGLAFKGPSRKKWEFKFDPIGDISAETRSGETHIAFIENEGRVRTFEDGKGATFGWTGALKAIPSTGIHSVLKERGPLYTNEWDLFSNRSDTQVQFSFDGGPEFRITSVTEQQAESIAGKYANLSMMALGVFSGRGVQDLRAITAYVTQGKSSWIVNESTGARTYSADSTSYAPDIFADTVLDRDNGIGKYAKSEGIDWNGLALAKRFCKNNGLGTQLFMDGVIADITSWRQFWVENAPFSLLEFARIGGRETLIPAVPTNTAGAANREVNISALFTTGNILEGSYKEEFIDYGDSTQDIIATVIYRETETQDVFPRNASVQVQLSDVAENNAIRQTFDASQFVTLRGQAILFGKLVCNQRRHIRRGIEFKTFPTDSPISPGAYIYVDIGLQTWDGITSGVIMEGGELNAPLTDGIANGSYSVLTYKNDQPAQSFTSVAVTNGTAASLASKAGYMFVLGAQSNRKRVFRVTEVQMDEEGEVTVKAMEHPCEAVGSQLLSRIANFSSGLFNVR